MEQSSFLIQSSQNKNFGTAFCVHVDAQGSFLLTCSHVVEACGEEYLEVNGHAAKLIAKGSTNSIDLAVVYVEGFLKVKRLELARVLKKVDDATLITGFMSIDMDDKYLCRELEASIKKISKFNDSFEI